MRSKSIVLSCKRLKVEDDKSVMNGGRECLVEGGRKGLIIFVNLKIMKKEPAAVVGSSEVGL